LSNPLPDKAQAVAGLKLAQIVQLIKDNQLVTALVVFLAWQIGIVADAQAYVGGMC
jgi:hypothetical protein